MRTGFIDWTRSGLALYIFEKKGCGYTLMENEFIPLNGEPDASNLTLLFKDDLILLLSQFDFMD